MKRTKKSNNARSTSAPVQYSLRNRRCGKSLKEGETEYEVRNSSKKRRLDPATGDVAAAEPSAAGESGAAAAEAAAAAAEAEPSAAEESGAAAAAEAEPSAAEESGAAAAAEAEPSAAEESGAAAAAAEPSAVEEGRCAVSEVSDDGEENGAADGNSGYQEISYSREAVIAMMKRNATSFLRCRRDFCNELNSHFFERIMCMLLGIQLETPLPLPQFVLHVLFHVRNKPVVSGHQTCPVVIHDRVLTAIFLCDVNGKRRSKKKLQKFKVVNESPSFNVYYVTASGSDSSEFLLLNSLKEMVRAGDIIGVPLLLSGDTNQDRTQFIIPDYGLNLNDYLKTMGTIEQRQISLSVLATCGSIPVTNRDIHDRNICVSLSDILFKYKLMVQLSTCLIQLSWVHHGLITVIDWELFEAVGKKRPSSSTFWSNRLDPWMFKMKAIPILHIEELDLIGEAGLWSLVQILLTRGKNVPIKIKFASVPVEAGYKVGTVLEVYPKKNSLSAFELDPKLKNRWGNRLSSLGFHLKAQDKLRPRDFNSILNLLHAFQSSCPDTAVTFFPIPSDTGLVALKINGELIATQNIPIGTIVTFIPVSMKIVFFNKTTNPTLLLGSNMVTVVRKASPLVGFGSFATWDRQENANCIVAMQRVANNDLFALKSVRPICKGHKIVCDSSFITNRVVPTPSDSVEALSTILHSHIREAPGGPETRQCSQLSLSSDTDED